VPVDPGSGRADDEWSGIVRRASRGEDAAQQALVERFTPALLAQAEHRVGVQLRRFVDPADVVADVWFVALRRLPEFDPPPGRATATLLAYLGTVLLRRVRDLYRRHMEGKPAIVGATDVRGDGEDSGGLLELSAATTGVVTRVVRAERAAALRSALDELDPLDREVVVLRGIESQSNAVVAALTGLAPNNVSQRLRRALAKLRERLPASIFDDL
jgi:RNA polymerase sigma-70 factor, ECF subfamily